MIMIFVFVLRIFACMWSDIANDHDLDDALQYMLTTFTKRGGAKFEGYLGLKRIF